MRETLTIECNGLLLHGTSHIGPTGGDTGVLFLNSGTQPRSSRGDLYVHLADALAERGYKSFRVDLPGLGDSQGETPSGFIEFYKLVQEGTQAGCVVELVRELRRRYLLSGVVLMGICGGAQTSVFAAGMDHGAGIAGLALLDMPFFLYRDSSPPAQKNAGRTLGSRVRRGASGLKAKLHDWVLEQKWEPVATAVYNRLRRITHRTKAGSLPPNTNLSLVQTLRDLVGRGVPALMITAHPPVPEPPSFDYIGYVARRSGDVLKHVKIRGTTHSFVEGGGAEAVLEAVSEWLATAAARGRS